MAVKEKEYAIPMDIQSEVGRRVTAFNEKELAHGTIKYIPRIHGKFIYLLRTRNDEDFENIGRLTYSGNLDAMTFAIFKYSTEKYDPNELSFPGREHINGTLEGAMKAGLEAYPYNDTFEGLMAEINELYENDFTNEIVEKNLLIGPETIRPFKSIIKQTMYPGLLDAPNPTIASDTIKAYLAMGGNQEDFFELIVYRIEAIVYYTLDIYDLPDEVYQGVRVMFNELALILASSDQALSAHYTPRIEQLIEATIKHNRYKNSLKRIWKDAISKKGK